MDKISLLTRCKANICKRNRKMSFKEADDLYSLLPLQMQKTVDLDKEKGVSTWLTALPLKGHDFSLHKSAFQVVLALRYGWSPSNLLLCVTATKTLLWNMHSHVPKAFYLPLGTGDFVT